ncbi:hypothetical protein KAT92_04675, partial [Candidatus Babeliales bacterium]|nr:hypothetical protein [Candidatus Babeliales bacterium]
MHKKSFICKLFTSLILLFFLGIGLLGNLDAMDQMPKSDDKGETVKEDQEVDGDEESQDPRAIDPISFVGEEADGEARKSNKQSKKTFKRTNVDDY